MDYFNTSLTLNQLDGASEIDTRLKNLTNVLTSIFLPTQR